MEIRIQWEGRGGGGLERSYLAVEVKQGILKTRYQLF